ncbi:MAG TPA: hypothetical protein VLJ42_02755 [Solirubrobacteraceae bacterium]|nr:hypothetical protein [Solirubrobacteraceae bacterium]
MQIVASLLAAAVFAVGAIFVASTVATLAVGAIVVNSAVAWDA